MSIESECGGELGGGEAPKLQGGGPASASLAVGHPWRARSFTPPFIHPCARACGSPAKQGAGARRHPASFAPVRLFWRGRGRSRLGGPSWGRGATDSPAQRRLSCVPTLEPELGRLPAPEALQPAGGARAACKPFLGLGWHLPAPHPPRSPSPAQVGVPDRHAAGGADRAGQGPCRGRVPAGVGDEREAADGGRGGGVCHGKGCHCGGRRRRRLKAGLLGRLSGTTCSRSRAFIVTLGRSVGMCWGLLVNRGGKGTV